MKKFLVFICLLALISFAGAAFAASGGHVNKDADIKTDKIIEYTPKSDEVTLPSGTVGTVTLKEINATTPSGAEGFVATNIYLPTKTANKVSVMNNIVIEITGYDKTKELTVKFEKYPDTSSTVLYAFIKAKEKSETTDKYEKGKFYGFLCTFEGTTLSFTVDEPFSFFSETPVVLATAETVPTSGGSSGGCNAGYAGLLLFAAVPFFFRKKK